MAFYPVDEQETNLNYDPVLKRWKAYSCVPIHMSKLQKKAGDPVKVDVDDTGKMIAGTWHLTERQVSIISAVMKPQMNRNTNGLVEYRRKKREMKAQERSF